MSERNSATFQDENIAIVPAVYEELTDGVNKGYQTLARVLELVDKQAIKILPLTEDEITAKARLPASFDEGEREAIVVAKTRNLQITTNEKQIGNYCREEGILYLNLPDLLRMMWLNEILSKSDVRAMVNEIEGKDNIKFKSTENIFIDKKKRT
ncbi:MAG: hypothetical protein A7316_04780 [Candidatus Altiarchaeales archaeon WOR_SM1_86-2]|nr:MAG: hypothetical protein A7316_04780 [Candidatus Altiarchaeales archaeon WOR_SM1_86-2]